MGWILGETPHMKKAEALYVESIYSCLKKEQPEPQHYFPALNRSWARRLLIRKIGELSAYLSGGDKERLVRLFYRLGLEKEVLRRVGSPLKIGQQRALQLFVDLPASLPVFTTILPLLQHKNRQIRFTALLALINSHPEKLFPLLRKYDRPLSRFERMQLCILLRRYADRLGDYSLLFRSEHRTAMLLGLELTRCLERTDLEADMIHLCDSYDLEIRVEALRTLLSMQSARAEEVALEQIPHLPDMWRRQLYRVVILGQQLSDKALAKLSEKEHDPKLRHYFHTLYANTHLRLRSLSSRLQVVKQR